MLVSLPVATLPLHEEIEGGNGQLVAKRYHDNHCDCSVKECLA